MTRIYFWSESGRSTRIARDFDELARGLVEAGCDVVPVTWSVELEAIVRGEERFPRGPEEGKPLHLTSADAGQLHDAWLLFAEVPPFANAESLNLAVAFDYARYYGFRIAALFDERNPEPGPGHETKHAAPTQHLRALAAADIVLPLSSTSAENLRRSWQEEGCIAERLPRVVPIASAPATSLRDALASTPMFDRIALIEGSIGNIADEARRFALAGVNVRRFHWRPDSQSLLPGTRAEPELPTVGAGRLRGLWAVLPTDTAADAAEVTAIIQIAQGLGMRVALQATAETGPAALIEAELSFFADEPARDAALARGLRVLPRTATLRPRLRIGSGPDLLKTLDRPLLSESSTRPRPTRLFYWVGTTVTQDFNTGIQRVTRNLAVSLEEMGIEIVPVRWDLASGQLVHISASEGRHLARWNGPAARESRPLPENLTGEWLLIPEITSPLGQPDLNPAKWARSRGMRTVAIFYDLIPVKMPELYMNSFFEAYYQNFGWLDLVLPISWTAAADFCRYVGSRGFPLPKIAPCPLAGDIADSPRNVTPPPPLATGAPLRLLAVGTWEPRKNYPRLLRGLAEAQEQAGRPIQLTIVGRLSGFKSLEAEMETLGAATGAALFEHLPDEKLLELFEQSDATVFGSWEEGFGLPVLESLWHGRPCLCHTGSAMAEVAPGGGTLAVDMLDEAAIAAGLLRLADEPGLLARLGAEAVARPIRNWKEYTDDIVGAFSEPGTVPGWPLPAIVTGRPLLSCSITTYNRSKWLSHSLPRLVEATRPWRDVVEIVVCDNASTDDTPDIVDRFRNEANFRVHRNSSNVGMLGNLGATARHSRGAFMWLLGDDDLLIKGAIENVLEGIASRPEIEMVYLNYAYTNFNEPEQLASAEQLIAKATTIAPGGPNRYAATLREIAGLNENLFTAIYACVFRRDHAMRAYQTDTRGAPFTSMRTCIPSSVYTLATLCERPAWWVGEPAVVVNMNVSWLRWVLLWHLERMPDLYQEAELRGVDRDRLDLYLLQHLTQAEQWVRSVYFEAEDSIRANFSLGRLLERCKHLPEFRDRHLPGIRNVYAEAWAAGRVSADTIPPERLFSIYGLAE
jgi:glycosyltransferase involved in cell wall biosynthesis